MILYYAGVDRAPKDIRDAIRAGARHFMISYYYNMAHRSTIRLARAYGTHIMLDSGAYSAWKKGERLDVEEYIEYIRASGVGKYVALDIVGDPEASAHNLQTMEAAGLVPIPVFHYGSTWDELDQLAAKYPYIALGGTVGLNTATRREFFRETFERQPNTFYHGLGLSTPSLLREFPWFSADSTTWLVGKRSYRQVTDGGQVEMSRSLNTSERVEANVRYFSRLEQTIQQGGGLLCG